MYIDFNAVCEQLDLRNVARYYGIESKRDKIECLSDGHEEKTPSMHLYPNSYHCFGCGEHGNVINFTSMLFNIPIYEAAVKLANDFSLNVELSPEQISLKNMEYTQKVRQSVVKENTEIPETHDFIGYYRACHANVGRTDYPQKRGLSEEIINRFKIGYDENYQTGTGGKLWKALIIPTGKGSYIVRNTDENASKENRYRKNGVSQIYHSRALKQAEKPIFITEGEIDALSIMTVGGEAAALGSTSNVNKFIRMITENKPVQPLILALDLRSIQPLLPCLLSAVRLRISVFLSFDLRYSPVFPLRGLWRYPKNLTV